MQLIPLKAIPKQAFQVVLNEQTTQLNIYTTNGGLFMDVLVNNVPIIYGTICLDRVRIIRDAYLGFKGDLLFFDTEGKEDPGYTGLGTRFLLAYVPPEELV